MGKQWPLKVDSVIRERAGLEAGYKDLLNIQ